MAIDGDARRAAVSLLARGVVTVPEAARLAGVSRQLVRYWAGRSGIRFQRVREARLAKWWRKELNGGERAKIKQVDAKAKTDREDAPEM